MQHIFLDAAQQERAQDLVQPVDHEQPFFLRQRTLRTAGLGFGRLRSGALKRLPNTTAFTQNRQPVDNTAAMQPFFILSSVHAVVWCGVVWCDVVSRDSARASSSGRGVKRT